MKWLDRFVIGLMVALVLGMFVVSLRYARGLQTQLLVQIEQVAELARHADDLVSANRVLQEIQTNVLAVLKKLDVEPDGWRGSISLATEEIKQCVCGDAEKVGADG